MSKSKEDFDALQKPDALLSAVKANKPELVEQLLKDGADPDAKDDKGCPALHLALRHPKIFSLLLDKGADANATFTETDTLNGRISGETPVLLSAIKMDCVNSACLLIEHGANIGVKDNNPAMSTALMLAVSRSSRKLTELLLDKGAPIDEKDRRGDTALIRATSHGLFLPLFLIERGADPTLINNAGFTAEDIARQNGHVNVADMLKQAAENRRKLAAEKALAEAAAQAAQNESNRHEAVTARQKFLQRQASKIKLRLS